MITVLLSVGEGPKGGAKVELQSSFIGERCQKGPSFIGKGAKKSTNGLSKRCRTHQAWQGFVGRCVSVVADFITAEALRRSDSRNRRYAIPDKEVHSAVTDCQKILHS